MLTGVRIALLYAPPWKIAAPDESPYPRGEGPPLGNERVVLGGDFIEAPYGLLAIAAQCIRAGHDVRVLNLCTFPWPDVEAIVARLDADVFGLSVFTVNRRGSMLLADQIRQQHPGAHICVGGPHATALAREIIERCPAVDTVVSGEGEPTFFELLDAIEAGRAVRGIAGLTYRGLLGAQVNPPRDRIVELDALVDYHALWKSPFVITSRGCPGECTYCGSNTTWGVRLRFHSVSYTLDMLERTVAAGVPLVAVKDDTFTSDRRRARRICEGIIARGLRFSWTCDTRIDALDEPTLEVMRRAGCVRLSLGVETPVPEILARIKKRQRREQILEITRIAQRYGFLIRYYMMVGNRGETWDTFEQSLAFVHEARPNQYLYSPLAVYPGTEEWTILSRDHGVSADFFFTEDFVKPVVFPETPDDDAARIARWLADHPGIHELHRYGVAELEAVAERLPTTASVWMDLAGACVREGRHGEALQHVARATELGFPMPGIGETYLAAIARDRGEVSAVRAHLASAARGYPHEHVMQNAHAFDAWEQSGREGPMPAIVTEVTWDLACELSQPTNPGPIDLDALRFGPSASARESGPAASSSGAASDRAPGPT